MKIINIVHFPAAYHMLEGEEPEMKWQTKNGKWCGIWKGNWSHRLGDAILAAGHKIDYEVWRPDLRADLVNSHVFENGLIYRIFPAVYKTYFWGFKRKKVVFSNFMIDHIDKYVKANELIVIHISAGFRCHDKLILDKFYNKVPFVAQFYTNPFSNFIREKTKNIFKYFHRKLIWNIIDNYYEKIRFIIPSIQNNLKNIEEKYNIKIFYRKGLANFGIDIAEWYCVISKTEARKLLNIDESIFTFFSSSRLIDVKQIDLMIYEFSKLRNLDFRLFISGNGEMYYEDYLKSLVIKYKMEDKIKFIGYVTEETLKKYYVACDTFISCSKSEAGPYTTALAMYYEKPVITTNTGLVYELLNHNNSGLIIEKDNSSKWHEEFDKVLNGFKIPICPRSIVCDFFDWNKISQYYINLYQEVLKTFYESGHIGRRPGNPS